MKTKKIKTKTIIIIAVLVLLLAAGIGAYVFFEDQRMRQAEEQSYNERIDEELNAIVVANCNGVELRPESGDFSVTDIDGEVRRFSVKPQKNEEVKIETLGDEIRFRRKPETVSVDITFEGEPVFSGTLDEFRADFTPPTDGVYSFRMTARIKNAAYDGTAVYSFDVRYEVVPKFYLSSGSVNQGSVMIVYGENIRETASVEVSVPFAYEPVVVRHGTKMYSLIPFNFKREAGEYTVTVKADGEEIPLSYTVNAIEFPSDYEEQEISLSDETAAATVNNSGAYAEYNNLVAEIAKVADDTVYWTESFIKPCEGTVTSDYAYTRYINEQPGSTHAGVDLACDEGTPVCASNAGRVIFAGELKMSGNTVIIEHGNGLQTKYLHMSALNCKENDIVERGQQIGAVGMTGLATGPHLHFEVDVSGACISPWPLLDGTSDIYKIRYYQ